MADLSFTGRKTTHFEGTLAGRAQAWLKGLFGHYSQWHSDHVAGRELRRLDARLLADIGLARNEASGAVEELPERQSAEPVRAPRRPATKAEAPTSYRDL